MLGYPLINVKVNVLGGKFSLKRTNIIAIEMAADEIIRKLIVNAEPIILEPVVELTISTPKGEII